MKHNCGRALLTQTALQHKANRTVPVVENVSIKCNHVFCELHILQSRWQYQIHYKQQHPYKVIIYEKQWATMVASYTPISVIKYAERPLHNVEERRRLVTQFSDQRLHLRGMLNGRSSPCTNESTVDHKPASVYRQYRSSDATPVWHPCHGRRTVL